MILEDKSILLRSSCGRDAHGKPIMYELRFDHPNPTAAMLRRAERAIQLLVLWADEDERKEPSP